MRFESRRGPKRKKEKRKKRFCKLESYFFFGVIFSLILLICTSKMTSGA
jgi:hypothetical protein